MNIAILAAAAFNLVCSGTHTTQSIVGDKSEAYSYTYRINLDQKKWCDGECKALSDIADIQPTQITLEEKRVDTPSEKSLSINFIDRETGTHTYIYNYSSPRDRRMTLNMKWQGQCERAEFTGFPKFETKF